MEKQREFDSVVVSLFVRIGIRTCIQTYCNTQVKTQLAEKAVQAAKAAEEALTGKKVVVDQLQEEVREAQSVVQEESSSLEQEQANVNAALQAARQSQDQVIYLNLIRLRNILVNWNPSIQIVLLSIFLFTIPERYEKSTIKSEKTLSETEQVYTGRIERKSIYVTLKRSKSQKVHPRRKILSYNFNSIYLR